MSLGGNLWIPVLLLLSYYYMLLVSTTMTKLHRFLPSIKCWRYSHLFHQDEHSLTRLPKLSIDKLRLWGCEAFSRTQEEKTQNPWRYLNCSSCWYHLGLILKFCFMAYKGLRGLEPAHIRFFVMLCSLIASLIPLVLVLFFWNTDF